jgi:hypothetical protein
MTALSCCISQNSISIGNHCQWQITPTDIANAQHFAAEDRASCDRVKMGSNVSTQEEPFSCIKGAVINVQQNASVGSGHKATEASLEGEVVG